MNPFAKFNRKAVERHSSFMDWTKKRLHFACPSSSTQQRVSKTRVSGGTLFISPPSHRGSVAPSKNESSPHRTLHALHGKPSAPSQRDSGVHEDHEERKGLPIPPPHPAFHGYLGFISKVLSIGRRSAVDPKCGFCGLIPGLWPAARHLLFSDVELGPLRGDGGAFARPASEFQ